MMYVYILTNPGKNVFYTGVTNDIKRRVREHEKEKGSPSSFCGKYFCYKLVYFETFANPKDAIKREKEIKTLTRAKKLELIKKMNPQLVFYRA